MQRLKRHWFLCVLFVVVALGLGAPGTVGPVAEPVSLKAIVMIVIFLMAVTLPREELWRTVRRPGPIVLALVLSYGCLPALAWLYCQLLMQSVAPDYAVGLLVAAAVPCTLISATAWTHVARGNSSLALVVTLASNCLCFVATTALLAVTTGEAVSLDIRTVVVDLIVTIVLPMLGGQLVRLWSPVQGITGTLKPAVRAICQLMILVIVFKASAVAGQRVRIVPGGMPLDALLLVVTGCLFVHISTVGLAAVTSRALRFGRADTSAILFASSQKTLLAGLYLIDRFYGDYALAAIPMLLYHVLQLVVDSFIAHRLARSQPTTEAAEPAPSPTA